MKNAGRPYFPDDDDEDASLDIVTTLHEAAFGERNEFFDDHQKWMVDVFDYLRS